MPDRHPLNAEQARLEAQREGRENWRLWGPYVSERAWGTVREDYSPDGSAWEYFHYDQAVHRAYRWSEDGIAGLCDVEQRLIFALALWNGRDAILKERLFGLTGHQGNHGEDVKECYFYLDATPSHSWLRYRYKYPQREFPYAWLLAENARRTRADAPVSLHDSGVFEENRYWDIEARYAKLAPEHILMRLTAANRGPEAATLWLLPTLLFRNTWSWNPGAVQPRLREIAAPTGAAWAIQADHPSLGKYFLYGRDSAELLFTENESNAEVLWGVPNAQPYVKDAFHRHLIQQEAGAINPAQVGTKASASHCLTVAAAGTATIDIVLSRQPSMTPFVRFDATFSEREAEAAAFYDQLLPQATAEESRILRQALSGLIWNKQFYHYDVACWLDGDCCPPPDTRKRGRNHQWRHLRLKTVISMPDKWEYPWFAAWDLAFHSASLALLDVDFAKDQLELLLKETSLHPDGLIPAYEWGFGDVNPPVHAAAALKAYRAERVHRGREDRGFLKRVLHKLLLHYAWWINRKDQGGQGVFEGGFMGLDNISVFNRSRRLPPGFALKQADATGWMGMFALNLTLIALELTIEDPNYEDIAIQCYKQFLHVAAGIAGHNGNGLSLWDEKDGFYKDLLLSPDGGQHRIDVFSWVGIIPLFACEVVDRRLLRTAPRFAAMLDEHENGGFDGRVVCACPVNENERGEHLLSLASPERLTRILNRVLDEEQFLSRYGVRSVSKVHATRPDVGELPGIGQARMEYQPGESTGGMFGGNSNWRGPIWLPTNYLLIQAIEKYYRYLGKTFTVAAPCLGGQPISLKEVANLLAERIVDIFRRDAQGRIPAFPADSPLQGDPHWQDLLLFHEYFHGENGQGLGAQHQTGWTALVANLVFRRHREEVPAYWRTREEEPDKGERQHR